MEDQATGRRLDLDISCGHRAVFGFVEYGSRFIQPENSVARHSLRTHFAWKNAYSLALNGANFFTSSISHALKVFRKKVNPEVTKKREDTENPWEGRWWTD